MMNSVLRLAFGITALALVVASVPALAGPDEVVAFRKHVMGTQGNAARQLRAISRGDLDQDENFAHIANVMVEATRMIPADFGERVLGSETEIESTVAESGIVWEDWEDFTARTEALLADSLTVQRLANAGDLDGAKAALDGVFSHCRDCHNKFRDR